MTKVLDDTFIYLNISFILWKESFWRPSLLKHEDENDNNLFLIVSLAIIYIGHLGKSQQFSITRVKWDYIFPTQMFLSFPWKNVLYSLGWECWEKKVDIGRAVTN